MLTLISSLTLTFVSEKKVLPQVESHAFVNRRKEILEEKSEVELPLDGSEVVKQPHSHARCQARAG